MSQQSLKKLHAHHGLPIWRYADLSQRNWYAGWSYLRYFLNCYHRTPETISTLYLFIYLFIFKITFLNPYLEMRNSGLLFFLCIKCTAGKQKKNNMWFIGILICFKPAKPTEFPRQPLRVKAHQRKKMKKKKKKEFHVTWGAFTVASEATVGRCTEKMSLPPMLCICACSAIQFRLE